LLGRESVPQWFKWVKEANPKMATEINGPYGLDGRPLETQNRGAQWPSKDTEGLQYYYDLVSWLLKQGTPIDYIGFQNHSGIGAAGPEAVLKSLNDFSGFGKPLEITEFEVTIQNANDPEQRQYQADYLRDYFTAVFSHPQVHMIMLQDFWQPAAWQYEGAARCSTRIGASTRTAKPTKTWCSTSGGHAPPAKRTRRANTPHAASKAITKSP
jgi:hypothetical protein